MASGHPDPYPLSAALAFYRLVQRNPTPLWRLIARWGDIPNDPVREVVFDCLRGVLNHWYDRFILRAQKLAARKPRFASVLLETLEIILPYYRIPEARALARRMRAAGVRTPVRRKPTLDEILEPGNVLFSDELFDRLPTRRKKTAGEWAAFRVHLASFEVLEAGFGQFFYNTPVREIRNTLAALRRIGAKRSARDVERAIALYGKGGIPRRRGDRLTRLEELKGPRRRTLTTIERRFPPEDLDALLRKYVSEHREEFLD